MRGQYRRDRSTALRNSASVHALVDNDLRVRWAVSGTCGDNAAIVSFIALIQRNILDRQRWSTRAQLRRAIVTWIEKTYHRKRRQRRLGRPTPIEFETHIAHGAPHDLGFLLLELDPFVAFAQCLRHGNFLSPRGTNLTDQMSTSPGTVPLVRRITYRLAARPWHTQVSLGAAADSGHHDRGKNSHGLGSEAGSGRIRVVFS
jgi:hypothetical protein